MKFSNLLTLYSTRETKCKPFFGRYFLSIPVYIGIETKLSLVKIGKRMKRTLHFIEFPTWLFPYSCFTIPAAVMQQWQKFWGTKESFLRNRSLDREFLTTLFSLRSRRSRPGFFGGKSRGHTRGEKPPRYVLPSRGLFKRKKKDWLNTIKHTQRNLVIYTINSIQSATVPENWPWNAIHSVFVILTSLT